MITSPHNPKIKWVRELQTHHHARREARAFVIEGVRLVEEAQATGRQPLWVIYMSDLNRRGRQLVQEFRSQSVPVEEVTPNVLKAASDTGAPQGILAVMPILEEGLPPDPDFLLISDTIRDPGNLGTIMRTALAARVQAIFLTPGSVDCYSPKVVRSAMGAHFRMPVFEMDWEEIDGFLSQTSAGQNKHIYLADSKGGLSYFQADFRSPLALIVGGEAEGAGKEARQFATERVHIPMPGRVESLNAAVAASILLFEVVRQRMHRTGESPGKRKT